VKETSVLLNTLIIKKVTAKLKRNTTFYNGVFAMRFVVTITNITCNSDINT